MKEDSGHEALSSFKPEEINEKKKDWKKKNNRHITCGESRDTVGEVEYLQVR